MNIAPTPAPELPEFVTGMGHTVITVVCTLLVIVLLLILITKRR